MKELISNIFNTANERLKNPFIGTFILSFIVFNWKPILVVIFSSYSIVERIQIVDSKYTSLLFNLLIPLFFSLFYVLALPYMMLWFDKLSKKAVIGRKRNSIEIQREEINMKTQLAKDENKLESVKADFREISGLNQKIEVLTTQLDDRDKIIEELQNELNLIERDFNRSSWDDDISFNKKSDIDKEYDDFKNSKEFKYFREIGEDIQNDMVPYILKSNFIVSEKFIARGIVERIGRKENLTLKFKFTKKGEEFWRMYILELDKY